MPEVEVQIGGRLFAVACQEGEEEYLHTAAAMLDTEAQVLAEQLGRVPEARMLLMAGLMLADKTVGLEERAEAAEAQAAALEAELSALRDAPPPAAPEPERIEVPVLPAGITDTMAEIAARAEAIADEIEEKATR
ncbi:cell division protein ZapA [Roseivivax halodurans JCM 10272]|uniref:Cell division protein ZapA n=1 Tax=Roseivivax halodurans JCM 10272 TaxID=1449350 RepID=X7EHL2_9RHOB|nr:cell division protein ZapA [Roseivivax halodurans]ETX14628.1 cell division protein ZapA [Roseivivax halodurans JCM 10272]